MEDCSGQKNIASSNAEQYCCNGKQASSNAEQESGVITCVPRIIEGKLKFIKVDIGSCSGIDYCPSVYGHSDMFKEKLTFERYSTMLPRSKSDGISILKNFKFKPSEDWNFFADYVEKENRLALCNQVTGLDLKELEDYYNHIIEPSDKPCLFQLGSIEFMSYDDLLKLPHHIRFDVLPNIMRPPICYSGENSRFGVAYIDGHQVLANWRLYSLGAMKFEEWLKNIFPIIRSMVRDVLDTKKKLETIPISDQDYNLANPTYNFHNYYLERLNKFRFESHDLTNEVLNERFMGQAENYGHIYQDFQPINRNAFTFVDFLFYVSYLIEHKYEGSQQKFYENLCSALDSYEGVYDFPNSDFTFLEGGRCDRMDAAITTLRYILS